MTGYNSTQFDALVLRLAARRCRLWNLPALADHAAAHRYGGEHLDLAERYASFGRKVRRAALCDAIGIPFRPMWRAAMSPLLWEAGEHDHIRRYVMEDVHKLGLPPSALPQVDQAAETALLRLFQRTRSIRRLRQAIETLVRKV